MIKLKKLLELDEIKYSGKIKPKHKKRMEKELKLTHEVQVRHNPPPLNSSIEPEEFKEEELLKTVEDLQTGRDGIKYGPLLLNHDRTNGIFAPWAIYKEDFQSIGGHDPLYAPQSKVSP